MVEPGVAVVFVQLLICHRYCCYPILGIGEFRSVLPVVRQFSYEIKMGG